MNTKASFDVIVIGTGSAGFSAIEAAVKQGVSVCAIEQGVIGGECANFACIPSKSLLKTASVYRTLQQARAFGIQVSAPSFDFGKLMSYRDSAVHAITGGGEKGDRYKQIFSELGVDVRYGKARFIDEHMIEINGENLYGKTIVIATGTVDVVPSIQDIDRVPYKRWSDALNQKRQPKSMAIIGGGPVGCELATFYASFGTRVVLLQQSSCVLNREDQEISALALECLKRNGVDVRLNAQIDSVIDSRGGVYGVRLRQEHGLEMIAVDQIVLAAGKRANVEGLNLDATSIVLEQNGSLKTTKDLRTTVSHIFSAGDVNGGMMFTHVAYRQGTIAGTNAAIAAKKKRLPLLTMNERVVPRVTFLASEVASVGMTSEIAKKEFKQILVGRCLLAGLGRAVTDHQRFGLMKLVIHPKTRKILGGHMIGERAGEVIHEVALAMHLNATVDKLAEMIHAFPTYSEAVVSAASNITKE